MSSLVKTFLLTTLLLSGPVALATPDADARYIAQRNLGSAKLNAVQRVIKESFVEVYFRPIKKLELGIKIIDKERFIDLIPDEDVAPFLDQYLAQSTESYLKLYTAEQLSSIATLLRADENASMEEILSEQYRAKQTIALEQAHARAQASGSDNVLVTGLEEIIEQLDAIDTLFDSDSGEGLAQVLAEGVAPIFTLIGYHTQILAIQRKADNPVTIAALKADGVLRFANPVQRQTALRQLSAVENAGGIRFIKPPVRGSDQN